MKKMLKNVWLILGISLLGTPLLAQQWLGTNAFSNGYRYGNTAIGLSTPQTMLHISRNSSTNPPILRLSGGSSSGANTMHGTIEGSAGSSYVTEKIVFTQQAFSPGGPPMGSIQFWTREPAAQGYSAQLKKRMTLDWNGRLGIGTDNPGYTLDVVGSGRFSSVLAANNGAIVKVYARVDATNANTRALGVRLSNVYNFQVMGDGRVFAREVEVTLNNFPDYVFEKDYPLMTLGQVKEYIEKNKHLPNIPSAQEIEANGLGLGELSRLQMEKIEELTIYAITADEKITELQKENNEIKNQLEILLERIEQLENK